MLDQLKAAKQAKINMGAVPPEDSVNDVRNWNMANWDTYRDTWGTILTQFNGQPMDTGQTITNASVIENVPLMPAFPNHDLGGDPDPTDDTETISARAHQLSERNRQQSTIYQDTVQPTDAQRQEMGIAQDQNIEGVTPSATGDITRTYSNDNERNTIGRVLRLQEIDFMSGNALLDPVAANSPEYRTRVQRETDDARTLLHKLFGGGAAHFMSDRNYIGGRTAFDLKGALDRSISAANTLTGAAKTNRENLIEQIIRMEPREAPNPDLLPDGVANHTTMNNNFLATLTDSRYNFIQRSTESFQVDSDGANNFFERLSVLYDQNAANQDIRELIRMKYVQYAVYNQKRLAGQQRAAADAMKRNS